MLSTPLPMRLHRDQQAAHAPRAEQLATELEASLIRELARNWRDLNRSFFKEALRAPVMRLVETRGFLGRWDPSRRTIEFSRSLVLASPWAAVVEVLKHEMAHQYAHEVLDAVDETAHGPAFRSVCEKMGADPAARGLSFNQEDDPARVRVLRRVTGLLALAESPNRHEAETAAALAQRLMLKHNMALSQQAERQSYGFRHLGTPSGRVQESSHILAVILADHFFVEAIWVPAYRPRDGKRGSILEICGSYENLEIASYVHGFLLATAERLWTQHKRDENIDSNRERRRYHAGVMEGFSERLNKEKRRCKQEGLVWVGDADLNDYHRRRHPYIRSVRLRGHGEGDARSRGRQAGRDIVLRRGIASKTNPTPMAALPPKRH